MKAISIYNLLNQTEHWGNISGERVEIDSMNTSYKRNVLRMLERNATRLAGAYGMGEISFIFGTTAPTVIGVDRDGRDILGAETAIFAPGGDMACAAVDRMLDEGEQARRDDPLAWLRTTPLVARLIEDIDRETSDGRSAVQRIVAERSRS